MSVTRREPRPQGDEDMVDRAQLESLFVNRKCGDFKWIKPDDVVVEQWVRMKCMFGCKDFGGCAACPPNTPSVPECERLFSEYDQIAMFHFAGTVDEPEDRHAWTRKINGRLLKLERDVFLAGHHKAFVLFVDPCNFCDECVPDKNDCEHPMNARPSPEGMAVDVFTTARNCGYDIKVLAEYTEEMNRFGMLLIE